LLFSGIGSLNTIHLLSVVPENGPFRLFSRDVLAVMEGCTYTSSLRRNSVLNSVDGTSFFDFINCGEVIAEIGIPMWKKCSVNSK